MVPNEWHKALGSEDQLHLTPNARCKASVILQMESGGREMIIVFSIKWLT
jgi:hypothetical protein